MKRLFCNLILIKKIDKHLVCFFYSFAANIVTYDEVNYHDIFGK